MKSVIEAAIKKTLKDLKLPAVKFVVEHPENMAWGDFSTNVGIITRQPQAICARLKTEKTLAKIASKIEVAGAGFINISIQPESLITKTNQVLKGVFRTPWLKKKVMLEFTDPNPFKEFHLGHLYTNLIGESLARILAAAGAEVKRVNYQGDVGLHVAKAVWGMVKNSWEEVKDKPLVERIKFMGQCYAAGDLAYETDSHAQQEIKDLNQKLYRRAAAGRAAYRAGRRWSLAYFETIYQRLGTRFDWYFFESEVGPVGFKLVRRFLDKGVFKLSRGAVIFPGSAYGLHDRVFINQLGLPTYEAKDLGLAPEKFKRYPYDWSIIITAKEVNDYFKVVLTALKKINPSLAAKTKHLGHGLVKLPEGKMSSRTGKIIPGAWLLDEAKKLIQKNYNCSDEVGEIVGQGAVKYALLKSAIGNDVVFDFNKSISFEGNSGPYLQYTHTRARSVWVKSRVRQFHRQVSSPPVLNFEEVVLLRTLYRFEEVVAQAAEELAPNLVANFIYDAAQKFNSFYNKHLIFGNDFRLWLTHATAKILKQGLNLLGISAPEKM
jgi:arginyl-tRNA synthetase